MGPLANPPEAPVVSDTDLIARVVAGEPHLFEFLVRRYNRRLYRVARAITRSDTDSEDVIQEAYCEAFAHLSGFEGRASFATWLTRIAVHAALKRVRRSERLVPSETLDATDPEDHPMSTQALATSPERKAADVELSRFLERAIDSLPEHYRTVFVLRAVEEMSGAETAACLGIEEETVKTRFHRARLLLQKDLSDRLDSAATSAFELHLSRCDRLVARVFAQLGIRASVGD